MATEVRIVWLNTFAGVDTKVQIAVAEVKIGQYKRRQVREIGQILDELNTFNGMAAWFDAKTWLMEELSDYSDGWRPATTAQGIYNGNLVGLPYIPA